MLRLLFSLVLTVIMLLTFGWQQLPSREELRAKYLDAFRTLQSAEKLSDQAGEDETMLNKADELFLSSLNAFGEVANLASRTKFDSLLFFTKLQQGYINYILGKNEQAKTEYLKAISLKPNLPSTQDSFLFKPYLFTGGIYYNTHDFDSARLFYDSALAIINKYNTELEESQRLYNRLGVMYYETGNYRQAKNYIEKALSIEERLSNDPGFLVNYKINLASLLVKLEDFNKAKNIYEELVSGKYFRNEILHNLGIIHFKTGQPAKALTFFREVKYENDRKSLDLYYNLAMAFSAIGANDSMNFYLEKTEHENKKWNRQIPNAIYGMILKFRGDKAAEGKKYMDALAFYNRAIQQFHPAYNTKDVNNNPHDFTPVYSYINLFNVLAAKAEAQSGIYRTEKKQEYLTHALNSYEAAYSLADHVEKTYDSDEARLFLTKIKHTVHSRPIDVCILLHELSGEDSYLEKAYFFDQRNKASVLSFHVQEMEFRSSLKTLNPLLSNERQLKTAITRFSIQALNTTDSQKLIQLNDTIRDLNINLGKLQDKINDDATWEQIGNFQRLPGIKKLGRRLDKNTALISYHISEKELVSFIITNKNIDYQKQAIDSQFFVQIERFKNLLHQMNDPVAPENQQISQQLYAKLIRPLLEKISKADRLIIIPDDELSYLPYEALQDETGNYLVKNYAVQYQFSTALLGAENDKNPLSNILAMAPFNERASSDSSISFNRLPASGEEIKDLKGDILLDTSATKQAFTNKASNYGIIHLATHAIVTSEEDYGSYIAFYPNNDFRLYSAEISNMNLSSTQLVILSACETGSGQLIKGEGLMSLSRAFAYAGCHNIITSLWKAEDAATAYLSKQLHIYLDKNYTKDKALQLAKIDFLENPTIDPRLKSPSFWAHLVFIGHYERTERSGTWLVIILGLAVFTAGFFILKKLRRQT